MDELDAEGIKQAATAVFDEDYRDAPQNPVDEVRALYGADLNIQIGDGEGARIVRKVMAQRDADNRIQINRDIIYAMMRRNAPLQSIYARCRAANMILEYHQYVAKREKYEATAIEVYEAEVLKLIGMLDDLKKTPATLMPQRELVETLRPALPAYYGKNRSQLRARYAHSPLAGKSIVEQKLLGAWTRRDKRIALQKREKELAERRARNKILYEARQQRLDDKKEG